MQELHKYVVVQDTDPYAAIRITVERGAVNEPPALYTAGGLAATTGRDVSVYGDNTYHINGMAASVQEVGGAEILADIRTMVDRERRRAYSQRVHLARAALLPLKDIPVQEATSVYHWPERGAGFSDTFEEIALSYSSIRLVALRLQSEGSR